MNQTTIDLSLANFQLFQNTQRKYFSWSLYFLKSEILGCRAVALVKMGQFYKDFFGIFKILEHSFLSVHFQNVSVVQSGRRLRTFFCNSIKRELQYRRFSDNFPTILVQLFQNSLMISYVVEFCRVLGCRM